MADNHPRRIPLFPLPTVLFPGMPFPLHIFEPRYREMITRCIDEESPFGVLRTTGTELDDIHPIGCSASVMMVLQRYPGGEFDILARGQHRFRLIESHQEHDYLTGDIEWFDDTDDVPVAPVAADDLKVRILDAVRELAAQPDAVDELAKKIGEHTPTQPSFTFGRLLGFPAEFQIRLLESRSEMWRLQQIAARLDALRVEQHIRQGRQQLDEQIGSADGWPGKSGYGFAGPDAGPTEYN